MYFLIALIFISKISLQFIPGIPYEMPNIIFQYGIHPYVNIILCLMFGGTLIAKRLLKLRTESAIQLKIYSFSIFIFCVYLFTITSLQVIFLDSGESAAMQMIACGMSMFMIYLFGKYLPTQLSPRGFVIMVQKYTVFLCWISLALLFVSSSTSFMGGRFIGVFKHIPHMVSVSTLAFVFSLYNLFCISESRIKKIYLYLSMLCAAGLLILTGTRSALASVVVATILSFILFKSKTFKSKLAKVFIITFVLTAGLFFGADVADYAIQVSRGEKSVGLRAAQDGVSSRWDEVMRGYASFQEQPWLGYGILNKFGQAEDGGVGSYNANKDPHNIIISAGVVGGWGFIVIISLGFISLFILTLKRLT
ncbi:MAG: O-antigen ligase family protein, partial [Bdellovibrionaceae bacterium]|nr:O-antigen ligase family protein [Pseudobdellovibrionaceae bacterium]